MGKCSAWQVRAAQAAQVAGRQAADQDARPVHNRHGGDLGHAHAQEGLDRGQARRHLQPRRHN